MNCLANNIELLNELYHDINELQKQFYSHLDDINLVHRLNFSKIEVRDVLNASNNEGKYFFEYIQIYLKELNQFSLLQIPYIEDKYTEIELRTRVKNHSSISSKLQQYNANGDYPGAYVLQKCLNDLFGFRVILDEKIIENPEFSSLLDELKNKKIIFRDYHRYDGDYKGHHSYFKNKSNLFLPWELQIWYNEDAKGNYASHFYHKQKYLNKERGVVNV